MESLNTYIAPQAIKGMTAADSANRKAIKDAAQDFEAVFVAEMFRPVFDSQEPDEYFGGGSAEKMYQSMMVDEYAKQVAKSGGIGIAEHVEKELLRLQEAK